MTTMTERGSSATTASTVDSLRVGLRVLLPLIAQGAVIRRPAMTALAERRRWEQGISDVMGDLRRRYGEGPLLVRIAGRRAALLLAREDVGRVLADSPEPFAAASREKRAALGHFQPHGVLVSRGRPREVRRRFNEDVLDLGQAMHQLAEPITHVVEDEVGALMAASHPVLDWPRFAGAHARVVRRIVLGDRARDDTGLSRRLDGLRRRANWAFAVPHDRRRQREFQRRLGAYLAAAEPDSLASVIAAIGTSPELDPYGQVPHWLFAFDALGSSAFRALAALAVDDRALSTVENERQPGVALRPSLTAAVLEALRLWPTTLVILRETTADLEWHGARLPAGTAAIIVSSFFHRDATRLPSANRLDLASWMDGTFDADPGIVPFSSGPVRCPGRDLVTFAGATMLAALLARHDVTLVRPGLDPTALPASLDHFRIRFHVARRGRGGADR